MAMITQPLQDERCEITILYYYYIINNNIFIDRFFRLGQDFYSRRSKSSGEKCARVVTAATATALVCAIEIGETNAIADRGATIDRS